MSQDAKRKMEKMRELINQSHTETPKDVQDVLNRPLVTPEEMGERDEELLDLMMKLIKDGKIDLYKTSTLMNEPAYEKLSPSAKAQAELDALNLLNTLRQIVKLYEANATDTYQFRSMLNQFRLTKERIEEGAGDIYVI